MAKERWELRLYIAGQTPKSILALKNITKYCEEYLSGQYSIEIIDLLKNPQLAEGDQIFAIPTLVRKFPEPLRKIIGDLSNEEKVLVGLNIRPVISNTRKMSKKNKTEIVVEGKLVLKLYVSGMSPKSMQAIENINRLCAEYLENSFDLEIIDLYKHPELAAEQQIVFSPSLIKRLPLPKKTLVGTFSDTEKVIKGLGISFKE